MWKIGSANRFTIAGAIALAVVAGAAVAETAPATAHIPLECDGFADRIGVEIETKLHLMREANRAWEIYDIGQIVSALAESFDRDWAVIGLLEGFFDCLGRPLVDPKH